MPKCDCGAAQGLPPYRHTTRCAIYPTAQGSDADEHAETCPVYATYQVVHQAAEASVPVASTLACTCEHAPGDDQGHKPGCPLYSVVTNADAPEVLDEPVCTCWVNESIYHTTHDQDCHYYQAPKARTKRQQRSVEATEATAPMPSSKRHKARAEFADAIDTYVAATSAEQVLHYALDLMSLHYVGSVEQVGDLCAAWLRRNESIPEVPSDMATDLRLEVMDKLDALSNVANANVTLETCLDNLVRRYGNSPTALALTVDAWLDDNHEMLAAGRYLEHFFSATDLALTSEMSRDQLLENFMNHLATKHGLVTDHAKSLILEWAGLGARTKPKAGGHALSDERVLALCEELRQVHPMQIPILFSGQRVPTSDDLFNYPLSLVFGPEPVTLSANTSAQSTYRMAILKGRNPEAGRLLYDPKSQDLGARTEDSPLSVAARLITVRKESQQVIQHAIQAYADEIMQLCEATGMRALSITADIGKPTTIRRPDNVGGGLLPPDVIVEYTAAEVKLTANLLAAPVELPDSGASILFPRN